MAVENSQGLVYFCLSVTASCWYSLGVHEGLGGGKQVGTVDPPLELAHVPLG